MKNTELHRRASRFVMALVLAVAGGLLVAKSEGEAQPTTLDRTPRLSPDYVGVTIPPNIAPLNFRIEEAGKRFSAIINAGSSTPISVTSQDGRIRIPVGDWRGLLEANRGSELCIDVSVQDDEGRWTRFQTIKNRIAPDNIDPFLAYRVTTPLHNKYVDIGLYQRNLRDFEETCILTNRLVPGTCINCHTFQNGSPNTMLFQIRSRQFGLSMVLGLNGMAEKVNTVTAFNGSPAAYSSWHPFKNIVASSVNKLSMFFHSVGESRDVFDSYSDLVLYRGDSNTLTTTAAISDPNRLETFPTWAPDGRSLYFSSAASLPFERQKEIRYDLMRIPFDPDTGTWGELDLVLSAAQTGKTILEPRVSPDGRFILVTMADHGNFPVYLVDSDLYMVNTETREFRRLNCNSERPESWHSWSTNGRWIAFSSKRRDGLFAQPHFSYIDAEGNDRRAFVLPQEDPAFYDACLNTYAVPEFATSAVPLTQRDFIKAIRATDGVLSAQLDPEVEAKLPGRPPQPAPLPANTAPYWDHQE